MLATSSSHRDPKPTFPGDPPTLKHTSRDIDCTRRIVPAYSDGWSNGPGKAIRKVGGLDKLLRQRVVQPSPFGPHVRWRRSVQQILHLKRIGCEIVELVFDAAAIYAEIDCVGPVLLPQRAQIGAGGASRQ